MELAVATTAVTPALAKNVLTAISVAYATLGVLVAHVRIRIRLPMDAPEEYAINAVSVRCVAHAAAVRTPAVPV